MNTKFIIYGICLLILCNQPVGSKQAYLIQTAPNVTKTHQNDSSDDTPESMQRHIAEEIIRLHVIANSDSANDQAFKLEVKDEIVAYLQEELKDAATKSEARQIILENLSEIEWIAAQKISEEGYSYDAKASLTYCDFPVKQYGDLTFPAGTYEALRVQIGKSAGRNWWCVMFPSLCKVDETYDEITDENKEKFKEILTEKEYESLLNSDEDTVFYKSGIKRLFDKVIDYFPIKE